MRCSNAVEVPDKYAGMVIGKGGNTVKDIMQRTGCKVNISQRDEAQQSGVRTATFRGLPPQVTAAKILVNEIISGAETGTPGYVGPDARKYLPGAAPIKGGGIESTIIDHIVRPPTQQQVQPRPNGVGMPPGVPVPHQGGPQGLPPGAIGPPRQGGTLPAMPGHRQAPPPGTGVMSSIPPGTTPMGGSAGGWENPAPGIGAGAPPPRRWWHCSTAWCWCRWSCAAARSRWWSWWSHAARGRGSSSGHIISSPCRWRRRWRCRCCGPFWTE